MYGILYKIPTSVIWPVTDNNFVCLIWIRTLFLHPCNAWINVLLLLLKYIFFLVLVSLFFNSVCFYIFHLLFCHFCLSTIHHLLCLFNMHLIQKVTCFLTHAEVAHFKKMHIMFETERDQKHPFFPLWENVPLHCAQVSAHPSMSPGEKHLKKMIPIQALLSSFCWRNPTMLLSVVHRAEQPK